MEADPTPEAPPPETPSPPAAEPAIFVPGLRAFLEVLACSGYPTQMMIGLFIKAVGLGPSAAGASPLTLRGLSALLVLDSIAIVFLVWWFLRARGESPRAVLFGRRPWTVEAAVGISLMPVLFMLVLIIGLTIMKLAPWLRPPPNPFGALLTSPQDVVVLALVGLIAGGVREEVQRAFILHRFEQHLGGAIVGLVCFSLLFGIGHVVQGWPAVVTTTALGAFWGIVYLARRSIVAPMVSHATFNLVQTLFFRLQV